LFRIVAVVGFKKSGKTAVVEGLVRELVRRGYRVGTVKHIRERGFTIDQPGKDTWRHARAGASVVFSIAPRETATIERRTGGLDDVLRLHGIDFLVIEGFRGAKGVAKIAVARTAADMIKLEDDFTIAHIGSKKGVPLEPREVKTLAKLVEARALPPLFGLDCSRCGYRTCKDFARAVVSGQARVKDCEAAFGRAELRIDGKIVPLKPFVQEFLARTTLGMLSSLKKAKGREIELRLRRNVR